nr:uncharacterized protein LOC9272174 [Oryza sativa Japonica Group]
MEENPCSRLLASHAAPLPASPRLPHRSSPPRLPRRSPPGPPPRRSATAPVRRCASSRSTATPFPTVGEAGAAEEEGKGCSSGVLLASRRPRRLPRRASFSGCCCSGGSTAATSPRDASTSSSRRRREEEERVGRAAGGGTEEVRVQVRRGLDLRLLLLVVVGGFRGFTLDLAGVGGSEWLEADGGRRRERTASPPRRFPLSFLYQITREILFVWSTSVVVFFLSSTKGFCVLFLRF